ncbi:2715_t:CDS:10 [Paraglomus brasilianum]|uniref:Transcription initiation factor IIA large subunit n=1 Tax=Paraglomus brasilianum TaxID=144538 RepID=A0A9N9AKQ2_9GLOM|nr:2715_t:CDS:10 [Paraglomus brasilianum]
MSNNVASVYRAVIDDVIQNVSKDFEDMGVDQSVLLELKRSWEQKVASSRVANWQAGEAFYAEAIADDALRKYQQVQDHETTTAAANLATLATGTSIIGADSGNGLGKPQQFIVQKNTGHSQAQPNPGHPNGILLQDGAAMIAPQNADAADKKMYYDIVQKPLSQDVGSSTILSAASSSNFVSADVNTKSYVSAPDHNMKAHVPTSEFDVKSNYANQPAPATVLPSGRRRHGSRNGNDDDINSDLDDSEDDDGAADGEESQNIILCLYDKDDTVVAFRDISPAAETHLLVVPKAHYKNYKALNKEHVELVKHMKQVAMRTITGTKSDDTDETGLLVGFVAPLFNTVPHIHLHVLTQPVQTWWPRSMVFTKYLFKTVDSVIDDLESL